MPRQEGDAARRTARKLRLPWETLDPKLGGGRRGSGTLSGCARTPERVRWSFPLLPRTTTVLSVNPSGWMARLYGLMKEEMKIVEEGTR